MGLILNIIFSMFFLLPIEAVIFNDFWLGCTLLTETTTNHVQNMDYCVQIVSKTSRRKGNRASVLIGCFQESHNHL